ncbi:vicilin-like seed storage protein At2g18540 [Nicotiana sylvestris]|uniref:vicilin-like seed storage protein At2g18540 n=1 Tax=Nicotiana sylvestris TaxID=4096 RepID=UPI00388CD19A
MKKASETPMRSWKDQNTIANLFERMQDYDSILAKNEMTLSKAKERIQQLNEEARSNKKRQVRQSEEDRAQFKKEKDHWIRSEDQLRAQLEEAKRYNREHQHVDIDRERAQGQKQHLCQETPGEELKKKSGVHLENEDEELKKKSDNEWNSAKFAKVFITKGGLSKYMKFFEKRC